MMEIKSVSDQVRNKIKIFEKKVGENFKFLEGFDYKSSDIEYEKDDSFYKLWASINYANESREISITYFPFDEKGEEGYDSITLSIGRKPEINNVNDYLDFDRYMSSKESTFDHEKLNPNNYKGDFEQRIDQVLDLYASLLKEYAMEIMKGNYWEKGHFEDW